MRIGIMAAMNEEVAAILNDLESRTLGHIGIRTYNAGTLYGKDVVITVSGWGKVAAASTAAALIIHYKVNAIVLFGTAGAASGELNIGDIIVAKDLIQHDLDPSPIFPKYQVPLLGISHFETDTRLRNFAIIAAKKFAAGGITEYIDRDCLEKFSIVNPAVTTGLIASGDQFISSPDVLAQLRSSLPDVKCVEMEGASAAQVCFEHKIPIIAVRVISDKADKSAHIDFPLFVSKVISQYSKGIIQNFLSLI